MVNKDIFVYMLRNRLYGSPIYFIAFVPLLITLPAACVMGAEARTRFLTAADCMSGGTWTDRFWWPTSAKQFFWFLRAFFPAPVSVSAPINNGKYMNSVFSSRVKARVSDNSLRTSRRAERETRAAAGRLPRAPDTPTSARSRRGRPCPCRWPCRSRGI